MMHEENDKTFDYSKFHKTSSRVIEKAGKPILLWSCTCGATKELPVNPGIYIGVRVESEKHYKAVTENRSSENKSETELGITTSEKFQFVLNGESPCSAYACKQKSLGAVKKDELEPYCLLHLSALIKSNRKRPKIIFSDLVTNDQRAKVLKGEWRENSIETNYLRSQVTEPRSQGHLTRNVSTEINFDSESLSAEVSVKSKQRPGKIRSVAFGLVVTLTFSLLMFWYSDYQGKQDAIEQLSNRNAYAAKCIRLSEEDRAAKSGPVGSSVRIQEVTNFYTKLLQAECVEWGDGTILRNVFFGVPESSAIFENVRNAFQYSLGRSNGVEPLVQRCADGWNSPSIGKQGACSSHGGVVSGFLEKNEWRLSNYLSGGEWIYPPLSELIEATQE